MAKPAFVQFGDDIEIPIIYEDRSVLAIDKPAGWMLVPSHWDRTARNLQLAIDSSIRGGEFWASSRNLKFLRFVHRLDAETTGVLLFAKSQGAVATFSRLFQGRDIRKLYLAVVEGTPTQREWECNLPVAEEERSPGRMRLDRNGKESLTRFKLLKSKAGKSLVLAEPITGRTHQIRLHLLNAQFPVLGDELYGRKQAPVSEIFPLALRAIQLGYSDPFTRKRVVIRAGEDQFISEFGFSRVSILSDLPSARLRKEV